MVLKNKVVSYDLNKSLDNSYFTVCGMKDLFDKLFKNFDYETGAKLVSVDVLFYISNLGDLDFIWFNLPCVFDLNMFLKVADAGSNSYRMTLNAGEFGEWNWDSTVRFELSTDNKNIVCDIVGTASSYTVKKCYFIFRDVVNLG